MQQGVHYNQTLTIEFCNKSQIQDTYSIADKLTIFLHLCVIFDEVEVLSAAPKLSFQETGILIQLWGNKENAVQHTDVFLYMKTAELELQCVSCSARKKSILLVITYIQILNSAEQIILLMIY